MTLLYLDGFEGYSADADFKGRPGWYTCNGVTNANCQTAFPSSLTEIGNSLTFSTPAPTTGNCPYNATYSKNNGVAWSNGTTTYQGWKAGGFSMGLRLKNNGNTQPLAINAATGAGNPGYGSYRLTDTIGFDGTTYWAIGTNASTTRFVAKSTNLQKWTILQTQPVNTGAGSKLIEGGGIICFGVGCIAVPMWQYNGEYENWAISTDGGNTWVYTAVSANGGAGFLGGGPRATGIASGNSTWPFVYLDPVGGNLKMSTSAGVLTFALTIAAQNTQLTGAINTAGLLILFSSPVSGGNVTVYSAPVGSSTINTTAAWTTATLTMNTSNGPVVGMAYSTKLNTWCVVSSQGVGLFAANGSAGAPQPITNVTPKMVFNPIDVPIAVLCINNVFCVYCSGGTIYYSADGYTWNQTFIPQINALSTVTYDGTRVILTSSTTLGILVTSSDGISNFATQYVADNNTYAQTIGVNLPNMITVEPNASPLLNGNLWTYPGGNAANIYRMGFYPGALTTVRGVPVIPIFVGILSGTGTWTNQQTIYIDGSTIVHYYELVATADPKNVNSFFWSLLVDGAIVYKTPVSYSMAPTTDTTSYLMFEPLCTSQAFNQFDDLYICLNDGKGISGPQGPNIVLPLRPSGDVQNQWQAVGTQSDNALALAGPTPSTNHNGVQSSNAGDKDVFTIPALPAGYKPAAVLVNAAVSRSVNGGSPQVSVGLITNGVEQDGVTPVTSLLGGSVVASMIAERAPDGSAWTATSLANSQLTLIHTE